ncbi:MAG: SAM-dependent DNA methyltransferase [Candidatus Cloacimonetes bacterium]|nr:SAM-dependent DNA methyltransferase [Candidatus Cloacimonadota bacterium]
MPKRSSIFNTIRTEGAILPAELLQRIVSGDATLEGLKSTDYHLSPSERLGEAATRSWNRLIGVWQTYRDIVDNLSEEAIGTTETRERWLLPLFQELGYGRLQTQRSIEIEDKTYPISHKASEPVAIHLVSFRWDLDKRPTSPLTKLTTYHLPKFSPHSLMQEFLNRSDDHLWGILSNGLKLRILRDNVSLTRAAYVEFDLQAMMDGVAYSDFFLLYLLCHQSRVEVKTDETGRVLPPETCWLEKWYNASIKDGVRALDELRNNVQSAIESLGAGFLSHPANTELRDKLRSSALTLQDYYHQVLLQVYRLLFIFVDEDRDLLIPNDVSEKVKQTYLKYYSTYRIRELARNKRGTRHSDLWQQLNLLFNGLYDGNPALGLPALGSFLFRASSTLGMANCEIANSELLVAVRYLCYTQKNNIFQPINYRNLGPEELGSVYESLLEMHPEINLDAGYFKLNIVSGSERKTTGSYYTPSSLVNCLLDSALEPVIADAVSGKDVTGRVVSSKWKSDSSEANPHSPLTTHHSPEQALLALKICDPACGSGHFLISAAHRLAKRLASIRAGEDEPAPSVIQHALRDVIGHCIYGVDLNLMAVELCKISLWMEALEPGKPLTFLDHHIQCGNSLLGCTPALLKKGIPDAAFTPLTGDDKAYCSTFKKLNKEESKGNIDIFSSERDDWLIKRKLQPGISALNDIADDNLAGLNAKERSYTDFVQSQDYQNTKLIYDAWCAAFVWIKDGDSQRPEPITYGIMESIKSDPENIDLSLRQEIMRLADEYKFFHWHIAFPDVFPLSTDHSPLTKSGFDCILGNPPWERVKLQGKEFFAARDESIAKALNASVRKKMIEDLPQTNPSLYEQFLSEKRKSEGSSLIIREGGFFPLCGRGDLNTYTVFAELNRILLAASGNSGCIVPSGIATDDTTKFFFQDLFDTGSLKSLYDFENNEGIFPAVDSRMKFCLLTMRGLSLRANSDKSIADFLFFAHNIADLSNSERHFQLSAEDIALINPNTRTCPIFRSKQDAELPKYIYRRIPVLINENDPENGNPWSISFMRMFDMSNDSHLFKTKQQLEDMGFELQGNHFVKGEKRYLPLYEAKMMHHFNHRFGDYADLPEGSDSTQLPEVLIARLRDPDYEPLPRYWVLEDEVTKAAGKTSKYWLGFRDITNTTNERTVITSMIPYSAVGHTMPLIHGYSDSATKTSLLSMLMNSFVLDWCSRQCVGGTHLTYGYLKQFPFLPPSAFNQPNCLLLGNSLTVCVLELLYTSYSLQPFAKDCGYDGSPFIWDEDRRFEIRCELDALYFHLYLGTQSDWQTQGTPELLSYLPTPRHAVEYIMETFPIVKRKDEKEYGKYRTKLRILEIYDQMTHCLATNTEYRSTLNLPPGPPCDLDGNFIPVDKWDKNNWPQHVHRR